MLQHARLAAVLEGTAARGHPPHPSSSSSPGYPNSSSTAMTKASSSTATGGSISLGGGSDSKKTRRAGDPPVSREEFERILAVCDLPYSLTWADATYELCNGEVGVQGEV
ncbi:unnamed protein product, partial [Ectocarpus sp. 12 AP-2014]